ncbi:MAG: ABC transporter substrate-binding protein, partial [Bacteroidetes bacterium]|nr:ABC transporter substrate-binding protein [Bacteroidota bacterium]
AIFGPLYSKQTLPASKIAEKFNVPLMASYSSHPEVTANKKYVFRLSFTDTYQAKEVAKFAVNDLSLKRFGILYEISDDYSRNLGDSFKKEVEKLGGKVEGVESYTFDKKTNIKESLLRLKQKNIEVIFLPNYFDDFSVQIKLIKKLNFKVTIIGGDANNFLRIHDEIPDYYFTDRIPTSFHSMDSFKKLYKAKMGQSDFDTTYADSYDGLNLLIEAIRRVQKTDPYSIMKSLNNFSPYKGITAVFEYHNSGDPLAGIVISKYSNGKVKIVKTCLPN